MSKHPEFVQSLVLKPWTRQMCLNYISLKKKKKKKQKQQKIKLSLHAGGGNVLASSSMLMSSKLV